MNKNASSFEKDCDITIRRQQDLRKHRPFLGKIYEHWYKLISMNLPEGTEKVLEVGSGPGFMKECIPNLVTSDLLEIPELDYSFDACETFPFCDKSLRGITMVNVFHHLPKPQNFLTEAQRCIKPGGRLVLVEPWPTPISSLIYKFAHHEPFDANAKDWHFDSTSPLFSANGAMPWIVFDRDKEAFQRRFPKLHIKSIHPMMPFLYLVSGGFSLPSLFPNSMFDTLLAVENRLSFLNPAAAMFALIVVESID